MMVSLDARGPEAVGIEATSSTTGGTVGDWLQSLHPTPPPALVSRLAEVLGPYLGEPVSRVPEACLEAGEQLLQTLLAFGSTSRASALDLLTVDALVTYAFQAGADAPKELEARAALAMQRIAALPIGASN